MQRLNNNRELKFNKHTIHIIWDIIFSKSLIPLWKIITKEIFLKKKSLMLY